MTIEAIGFWNSLYQGVEPASLHGEVERSVIHGLEFFGDVRGKRVLDLGCGSGGTSLMLAEAGAVVTALDNSVVAVEGLDKFLKSRGMSSVNAIVGEALGIAKLGQFDFVFGSLILHHIEPFADFCRALRGALKPGGKAFFYENNSASDLLVWFRRHIVGKLWVPKYGDKDEFPLAPSEIRELRRIFDVEIRIPEMLFFQLGSVYLFKRRLAEVTRALDEFCFRHSLLTRYSYRQNVMIQG